MDIFARGRTNLSINQCGICICVCSLFQAMFSASAETFGGKPTVLLLEVYDFEIQSSR